MERRRLSHSDDGALPYLTKRRKTGFQGIEDESIRERYKVAWICALHFEMAAARAMLDEEHADCPRQANDTNSYVLGSIQNHNVVIACLPEAQYGLNAAASVLSNMRRTFPNIEIGLMVGIGGGVPLKADIRLGDIVVGVRVMQYDMGKTLSGGFQRTGVPKIPDSTIRTVISNLRSRHELSGSRVPSILREKMGNYAAYSRPNDPDRLFLASYHQSDPDLPCDKCDLSKLETRKQRLSTDPVIYYGGIGSANRVMKDSTVRDEISRELDVLCFEMEAAGLMDIMPCLPIRGISDYSDSHKSKGWQRYAAATAAAYAYEFLELWRGDSQASFAGYHQPHSEHTIIPGRHEEILKSLDFEQIDARKLTIKSAHSKTCHWFLKNLDYLSWIDPQQTSQHHGFLWIRGKPGAGKSTIMKFIYLQWKKKDRKNQSLTASFFFNARGELLEKTVSGMYRSILLQLFHGFPDLECVLDDPDLLPRNQSGCPPLNVLKDLLRAAVAKLGQRSFRCFIDALDECDEQQVMDLVEYFEELAEQCTEDNINLRICFSSRHYPYIDIKFGVRIILEEQMGHAGDLESYIKSNLRVKDRNLLAELQEKMLEKAAGVPSGLSDLFKDLLKRDNSNMEELQLSLLWILLSERSLKPEEYYHAIWSGLYLEGLADLDIPEVDMEDSEDCFARCVISSSKGLAEITKVKQPRVQFIHESVRDFLIKDKGLRELWPELGPDWESIGHDRLKMCCYAYFEHFIDKTPMKHNFPESSLITRTKPYPFLEYASQFVLHHSDFAANTVDQQPFLGGFRLFVWNRVVNTFEKFEVRKYSPTAGLLYILADRGHSSLIQAILKCDTVIDIPSEKDRYVYPLIAAMAKGDKASVLALLRLSSALYEGMDITEGLLPNIDAGGSSRTPLSWACENGHFGIARVLVERDAQPVDVSGLSYSPLMLASKNGHIDIARWLLNHDADIHQKYKKESPIWLASNNGHAEVVELLLDAGADLNTCGVGDAPILVIAAAKAHEKVVKLLLKRRANVEANNCWKETALHLAAKKRGSKATMQALLSCGADINARSVRGRTPLFSAVECADVNEIGFLIEQGADVTAQDKVGENCLHKAIGRSKEIVQLLLGNGARADARNKSGETCLHNLALERGAIPSTGDIIQLVTSCGADINANDNDGNTPLHLLTSLGLVEILSMFADQPGVDFNARNHLGKTPLHLAISFLRRSISGNTVKEAIFILIRKGADINSVDNESRTPLDDAVEAGNDYNESVIQFLIDNGGKRGVT
ncbi:hypothetical protein FAGAP_1271 [Fusarium agapanthi]|uniref:Nucleoside phosphorylase domain-containing protein n=1 Tax=Fusarium agapanthi TaxID=1803897 RepID=A0A9P5EHW8_9HYPO|nr:hypothetical protein FAGAP_1271 [Fusarium agapanthi]